MSREAIAELGMGRLLERVQVVADPRQHRQLLQRLAQPRQATVLSFFNQHAFNLAWADPSFGDLLARSDVLLRDGVGVATLFKLLGRAPGLNMNGTDLIPQLVAAYKGRRVAVVGTAAPYLDQAVQRLRDGGANVVFVQDGFADEASYLDRLIAASPELVILGMGMPRQEQLADRLAASLRAPALIVNGGAIIDFIAGRFPRAPAWLRALRLEWLYRLLREPRRLWRRYVTGGVQFLRRMLRMAWRSEASAARAGIVEGNGGLLEAAGDSQAVFDGDEPRLAQLLQRVEMALSGRPAQLVQFVAARSGDGASTVAHAYALAGARLRGRRVLLLSDSAPADAPCLEDIGQRQALPQVPASAGVTVARPPAASQPGAGATIGQHPLWEALRGHFDQVVIDLGGPAGLLSAPHADGVVLVVQADATPAAAARRLLDDLAAAGANVLGAVLNRQHSYLPRGLRERF